MNFKKLLLASLCLLFITTSQAQQKITGNKKGGITVLWGWNRGWFTNSDINFRGDSYDFTLSDVVAKDSQTKFDPAIYFHPKWVTIPQTNCRIGYFITDNYEISIGLDHMKYVVQQNQKVRISGEINIVEDTIYNGIYDNDEIEIEYDFQEKDGFLAFEHSDGLNYINIECRRFDNILTFRQFGVNLTEGIGVGFLLPRTNASVLGHERYDQFHLAGYGFNCVIALNLSYKRYFIQSELKGGFINMPDIRTTEYKSDRASQHFFFSQLNFLVGYSFSLSRD